MGDGADRTRPARGIRPGVGRPHPSDLPLVTASQADIEGWEQRYPGLVDVWPLTPLQSGLLFHALLADTAFDAYTMQIAFRLTGPVDPARLRTAGQSLLDRYANLRVAFAGDGAGGHVQIVCDGVELPWSEVDLRDRADADAAYERLLAEDLHTNFDPARPPLLRMTLVRSRDEEYELVFTAHHLLFDGWSLPVLVQDLLRLYAADGDGSELPRVRGFRDFLGWLAGQDQKASAEAWEQELMRPGGTHAPRAPGPGAPGRHRHRRGRSAAPRAGRAGADEAGGGARRHPEHPGAGRLVDRGRRTDRTSGRRVRGDRLRTAMRHCRTSTRWSACS